MKQKTVLNFLIPLIALIAGAAALAGLFTQGGNGPSSFATLRGQTADIYGHGLYRFDTVFFAATFKGVDVITLVLSIPLLLIAFVLYRRNSLRGALLLLSAIPYFIYIGASMTFVHSCGFSPPNHSAAFRISSSESPCTMPFIRDESFRAPLRKSSIC